MKSRFLQFIVLIVTAAMTCYAQECPAVQRYRVVTEKAHPAKPKADGQALVYFVRDTSRFYTIGVAVDGKVVGASNYGSYFFITLDPGEHHVCAAAVMGRSKPVPGFLSLVVQADKAYYVELRLNSPPLGKDHTALEVLNDDQGRASVQRSVWVRSFSIK